MIFLPCTFVCFGIKRPKNRATLDNFLRKRTTVCQRSVSWRSNQEWRSICADTVLILTSPAWQLYNQSYHNLDLGEWNSWHIFSSLSTFLCARSSTSRVTYWYANTVKPFSENKGKIVQSLFHLTSFFSSSETHENTKIFLQTVTAPIQAADTIQNYDLSLKIDAKKIT